MTRRTDVRPASAGRAASWKIASYLETSQHRRRRNRRFGKVRAKVEHVFRVVKCQFGYRKVRYRGIAKNGAQVFALLALANLFLARRTLATA